MKIVTIGEAIVETIVEEMQRDDSVFMIGEDVKHGVYTNTSSLAEKFPDRLVSTPICEETIIGSAIGAALTGMRPIVDIHFNDFMLRAMDQIVNEAAKIRYATGGHATLPLVIRAMVNTGFGPVMGVNHSQNFSPTLMHIPGLKVLMPSTPYDAKGLLRTAIRGNDPVVFFEHGALYSMKGPIPSEDYQIPFGEAVVRKAGRDVTVVADAYMQQIALECAPKLADEGIDIELIDLRTLTPLDTRTLIESVNKTGRLVTAEQSNRTLGIGAEVSAVVFEACFEHMKAPVVRVAAKDAPIAASKVLENAVLPNEQDLLSAVRQTMWKSSH
ncbi:MAG: alpha-ketoacid dehydrogenase subunit beta [Nitrososphaerales archaeon]